MDSLLLAKSPDFIKQRLAKSELFNFLKDSCTGTHEKNVVHIVRKWCSMHKYA
eukprot:CAMPEP_0197058636 /NCGR_PEP_ID=MMETSP1384-20130603/109826_1 /TAXON_ID=29189 /ORGANISM="Ammonia sp." /LENGTH=52 /DNA_ID=CAMNT_0042493461 /DNA_START=1 /DNA_END=155 /DNA_ORIENTATION=+